MFIVENNMIVLIVIIKTTIIRIKKTSSQNE
jgi:hypothetical protein